MLLFPKHRGGRNMHNDLPEPVAIVTNTSWQCSTAMTASSCPGGKLENPKYFCSVAFASCSAKR